MAGACEAADESDLRDSKRSGAQKHTGVLQPSAIEVGMGTDTRRLFERTAEMRRTHPKVLA